MPLKKMTIKEYIQEKRLAQVEIASQIGAPISSINLFINGWKPLPTKHVVAFAKFVGLTENEVIQGQVKRHAKKKHTRNGSI